MESRPRRADSLQFLRDEGAEGSGLYWRERRIPQNGSLAQKKRPSELLVASSAPGIERAEGCCRLENGPG